MNVELLGTGGYFPNGRRQTASLLLPEWGIVLDGGSGLFRLGERFHGRRVDLFLTHAHLDHICGLPYLLMPVLAKTVDTINVYGTAGTLNAVSTHLFNERVFPIPTPFTTCPIHAPGELELEPGLTIRWQELPNHPGGSMAYRIDLDQPGRKCSFAYVTDTTADGSYEEFIHGVDLVVHECYFDNDRKNLAARSGHCYAEEVAEIAVRTQVKRMVLVHVDPTINRDDPIGLAEIQRVAPQVELGVDGMELVIPERS